MQKKNFDHKNRNFGSGLPFIGIILIITGIISLASSVFLKSDTATDKILLIGASALVIGLLIISFYEGTEIDPIRKKFKEYLAITVFKFGQWSDLKDIKKIKVISTDYRSSNTPNGISPTLSGKVTVFKILIYSDSQIPDFSFKYSNKEKAKQQAKQLADDLKADLVLKETE